MEGYILWTPNSTINEHINNIYDEGELKKEDTLRKFGNSEFSTKPTNFIEEIKRNSEVIA